MKNSIKLLSLLALAVFCSTAAPASAAVLEYTCNPTAIKEHQNGVVVWCREQLGTTGIWAIALSNTDVTINRFMSLAQLAMLSGKHFYTNIDTATTSSIAGCGSNCRDIRNFYGVWQE
jgi:hydrogenase maturation factor